MIDLKTIKEITIAEGSVTKITNSSGVVLWQKSTGSSTSLDVDLNNQWIVSTKTLDGYLVYMSNSNHNVDNGYASMKFKFKGQPNFKLWINSYAESNYDYTIAWDMDKDYPTSNPSYADYGAKAHTSGKQYDPANSITAFTEVDYPNDGGEHFVVVTYRKDSSVNSNDDRGYVAVKVTLLSTTWVLSSTEFIKKDGKYYERINEVGTYTDGSTALTGNYKEGNELTPTYIQSSDANDYMITDGKMYYKKYAYVTPVNTEINTGDYIQGDYIGEAIPSMKVTYTDNSEKTFYNLTSIEQDTDPNKTNAKNVIIYYGVTSIRGSAFRGCSSLTSITIPSGVTSIGTYAFYKCSNLTDITIPDSVTSISEGAFELCSSLTSITIPSGVTSIKQSTFYKCSNLTGITIPNSVTSIGTYAFYKCSSLTSITIPSGVTSINNYTFAYCSSLNSINIPSGVTIINSNAFYGCTSLESVTIEYSTSKITYEDSAFYNISSSAKLYVPSNLLSDYQADTSWDGAFGGGIYEIGS